jgi:hypothetical protein
MEGAIQLQNNGNYKFYPIKNQLDAVVINSLEIEWTSSTKSPLAPLFQRGGIPPFVKGR